MAQNVGILTGVQQGDIINMSHKIDPKKLHPLVRALKENKKGDSLQLLAKFAGLNYDPKYNILLDQKGDQMLPSKLFEHYSFIQNSIGCIFCYQRISVNVIFLHLQHGYQQGHRFDHSKIIQFFTDETNGKHDEIRENSKHFPSPSAPRSHY